MFYSPVAGTHADRKDAEKDFEWVKEHAKEVALYWLNFARDRRRFVTRGGDNGVQSI